MPEQIYQLSILRGFEEVRQMLERQEYDMLHALVPHGLVPYDIGGTCEDAEKVEYYVTYRSGSRGNIILWKEWNTPTCFTFTRELAPEELERLYSV